MTVQLMVCVLVILVPMTGCAQGNKVRGNSPAQSQIDSLAAKLANGEIGKLEILQIPARILTRTRITPEMIEKQFHYKLTIRDVRGGAHQGKLVEAMKSVAVQSHSETVDIRWALIFYGVDDTRIGALYFDKSGKSGAVDSGTVSFKGDLFKWLDDNFSSCFR